MTLTPHRHRDVSASPLPASDPRSFGSDGQPPRGPSAADQRKRRIVVVLSIIAAVLALLAGAGTVLTTVLAPKLENAGPQGATNDKSPVLVLTAQHGGGIQSSNVRVHVDGELADTTARISGERIRISLPPLAEGSHRITVSASGAGLLRRTVHAKWHLVVDTQAPMVRVKTPTLVVGTKGADDSATSTTRATTFLVISEPGAKIRISSSAAGAATGTATVSDTNRAAVVVKLAEGQQRVSIESTDAAGNQTTRTLAMLVDSIGPALRFAPPAKLTTNAPKLTVTGRDAHGVALTVTINDNDDNVVIGKPVGAETAPSFALSTESPLAEGVHIVKITGTDSVGNSSTVTRRLLVDSTESLGDVSMMRAGARGADVRQLQQALIAAKAISGAGALGTDWSGKVYGMKTRAAVKTFQSNQGLEADGVAGDSTIAAMTLKIVVDQSSHTVTLYKAGKLVKSWGVAVGAPEFPTPTGSFEIVNMQKNPTWTPPLDSAWAKDAKVIAPGPDNPLGTRWMGINSPAVGIHGTNNPASIGYSVSHGCMRMRIPDVEELFEMVRVGTPVEIR